MSNEMVNGFVETIQELEAENAKLKLRIGDVRLSLFNEIYDKFVECEDNSEFTQYLNENTNEA